MALEKEEWKSVLEYWFGEKKSWKEKRTRWCSATPEINREIEDKFGELILKARNDELKTWEDSPEGSLAMMILLDQFCRNIYKGKKESFSHDAVALKLAKKFLNEGPFFHKKFPLDHRFMIYVCIAHSEEMPDQDLASKLSDELVAECTAEEDIKFLTCTVSIIKQHKDVLTMFGRFPKRNAALGRKNTPEEEAFLKDNKYVF